MWCTTMSNFKSVMKDGFVLLAGLTVGLLVGYVIFPSMNPKLGNHLSVSNLLAAPETSNLKWDSGGKKPRILCWVMTAPENHKTRAIHVKRTWGKRCDTLLFMSTGEDSDLPAIKLVAEEGINNLWVKTKGAFRYIVDNHFDEADWFIKADDDTYVILENLRSFLEQYDTSTPLYFGCKFKLYIEQGYMSGGAGYVLSKEAVRRLVRETSQEGNICDSNLIEYKSSWIPEDLMLGKCLESLKVPAGDSRDEKQRHRFLALPPDMQFGPDPMVHWYWEYMFYQHESGLNCCSDTTVSFHYVTPNQMYALEFLLYRMKPFEAVSTSSHLQ